MAWCKLFGWTLLALSSAPPTLTSTPFSPSLGVIRLSSLAALWETTRTSPATGCRNCTASRRTPFGGNSRTGSGSKRLSANDVSGRGWCSPALAFLCIYELWPNQVIAGYPASPNPTLPLFLSASLQPRSTFGATDTVDRVALFWGLHSLCRVETQPIDRSFMPASTLSPDRSEEYAHLHQYGFAVKPGVISRSECDSFYAEMGKCCRDNFDYYTLPRSTPVQQPGMNLFPPGYFILARSPFCNALDSRTSIHQFIAALLPFQKDYELYYSPFYFHDPSEGPMADGPSTYGGNRKYFASFPHPMWLLHFARFLNGGVPKRQGS